MKIFFLGLILIVGIIGIYFIGSSITGYIVSETCCFPPNCQAENQCKFDQSQTPSISIEKILSGASLLIMSGLLYGLLYHQIYRNSGVRKR